jgi:hypothetical protein
MAKRDNIALARSGAFVKDNSGAGAEAAMIFAPKNSYVFGRIASA